MRDERRGGVREMTILRFPTTVHHPTGNTDQFVVGGKAINWKDELSILKMNVEIDFFLLIGGWLGMYVCLTWPIRRTQF